MAPVSESFSKPTENGDLSTEIETPILIVGGGPVGMLMALMFARLHGQRSMVMERESTTTIYPKMEYTNGRSMEIYRKMGLHNELRELGNSLVSEDYNSDEILVTSLAPGGKMISTWKRPGVAEMRKQLQDINDGSQYLEPHMRCHQIAVEAWLKRKIDSERLIQSIWGTSFVSLEERSDHVICEAKKADGTVLHIKSQYVIGCDGGGSLVRKVIGLESKRKSLEMFNAFVHYQSKSLRSLLAVPRFWHAQTTHGGFVVSQNENDIWTSHMVLPPGVDGTKISAQEIVDTTVNGSQTPIPVSIDKVYSRGVWKAELAIADRFRSPGGRVFLSGDAAHQLSPMGGHGLNSGLGDAFDLSWKLTAAMRGWAGESLLNSYDAERRQIALENAGHVQRAADAIIRSMIDIPNQYSKEAINSEGDESRKFRTELGKVYDDAYWIHNQNGNILGYSYKQSPTVMEKQETLGSRPEQTTEIYVPTTWPGSQSPRVWMQDGRNTVDTLNPSSFNLVDFSQDAAMGNAFAEAAAQLHIPLQTLRWPRSDDNLRRIYERELVLIRPDTHVAWRSSHSLGEPVTLEEAIHVLRTVTGRTP